MSQLFDLVAEAAESADSPKKISVLQLVLTQDPTNLAALEMLAMSYWRSGEFSDAVATVNRAIGINPAEKAYLYIRGDCLRQLQRYPEAARDFGACCASPDQKLAAEAAVQLEEVEGIQEAIAADIFRSNPELAKTYAEAPTETLASLGFAFVSKRAAEPVAEPNRAYMWARPS